MERVLVAYASKRGSTREVAEEIGKVLEEHGLEVDSRPAADIGNLDGYTGAVLGGALYMGRLHADARRFLARLGPQLATLPTAVFAMGPGTLEDKDVRRSREQLDRALAAVPELEPVSTAIFGGVVDPAKLRFPFNRSEAVDARDWDEIRSWGGEVAKAFFAHERIGVA
jgi:menaquinone-dependent protoporphyrinogen oxidase